MKVEGASLFQLSEKQRISRRKVLEGLGYLVGAAGTASITWGALFPRPLYAYTGHTAIIRDIAWSPDSKRIASVSDDGTMRAWDAISGKHAFTFPNSHGIVRIAWSPNGKYIISGGTAKILLWEIASGLSISATYFSGKQPIYAAAWSPDGTRYIAGGGDNTLDIWIFTEHIQQRQSGDDNMLDIWSFTDQGYIRQEYIGTYHGHSTSPDAAIYEANWSPDGKYIASSENFETVQIWDANTQATVFSYQGKGPGQVWAGVWSPDSQYIAFTDYPVTVVETTSWSTVYSYYGHATGLAYGHSVTWSPDSQRIASADDNTLHIWDAMTGDNVSTYRGKFVYAIKWSPDGQLIASIAGDTGGKSNVFTVFAGYPDTSIEIWSAQTSPIPLI